VSLTPTLIAAFPFAIWLYLFFVRGNFWQVREDTVELKPVKRWPRVVAIVPARDEAGTIARVIASLAKQDYPGEFSILVVDDHSSDGTADLARSAAEESGAAGRVTVHLASELPAGWTGKVWAMSEGIAAAKGEAPDYFWLVDADIIHAPETLHRLVSRAVNHELDVTSLMALLQAKTFPERLLIPSFLYFFLMLYPPNWVADPKACTAGAAGGCMLVRRTALERIGGMAAIRNEVIDDCALAARVKKSGGKIWLGVTRTSVSMRDCATFAEIRDMIARTAFTQLRYSFFRLLGSLTGLFVVCLLPWVLFFAYPGEAWLLVDTTVALMAASFLVTVKFYSLSWPWALTLPIAAIFYGYATCVSAVRYWMGRGGQWKGRVQSPQKQ
jgi:hopene-associated glycosyltransferase HpnB